MSFALHIAHTLIQNHFQALAFTHLFVRPSGRSLYIYSMEQQNQAYRAALTMFAGNTFILSLANPRGKWQPTHIGEAPELMDILTDKLSFALARWPK